MLNRFLALSLWAGLTLFSCGYASAQEYPVKPLRIYTAEPGGSGDFLARLIASGLSASLGQQVIVENRPAGIILAEAVARAAPDGYSLLYFNSTLWILPFLRKTPYDPVKDFSPISFAASTPNVLVGHPTLPVKSVKELIALAKSKPGALNYASTAIGGSTHLAAELFKSMAGVNIVHIPYKGAGIAITDLLAGQVELLFGVTTAVAPHIKSGRLRALAVTSAQPSRLAPGLPTIASAVPGYECVSIFGVFAPARTNQAILNRLGHEINLVLNNADVREKFVNAGAEPVGGSAADLASALRDDMAKWGKVIRDAGIKVE